MSSETDRMAGASWVATRRVIFFLFSVALVGTGLLPIPGFHFEGITVRVWTAYGLLFFAPPLGFLIVAAHWGASALLVFSLVCLLEKLQLGNH